MTMSKNRTQMLTLAATLSGAIVMVFFFHAPVVPVAIGALGAAVVIMMRRKPEA